MHWVLGVSRRGLDVAELPSRIWTSFPLDLYLFTSYPRIPSLVAILATTSQHPSIHLAHDIQRVDILSATQLLCFALESNILSLRRVFPI